MTPDGLERPWHDRRFVGRGIPRVPRDDGAGLDGDGPGRATFEDAAGER